MTTKLKRFKLNPVYRHFYVVFIYAVLLCVLVFHLKPQFASLIKPVSVSFLFLFGLSFLSTFWSIKIFIFQCCSGEPKGPLVFYENKLCEIKDEGRGIESFFFNNQKLLLIDNEVVPLSLNTEISFKTLRSGLEVKNYHLYPPNEFHIPKPSFITLFKEQCISPLFCFQIFSSLLMCLDEHIISSLISTGMIIFVEATFVLSRVTTMKIFRKLEHKSFIIKRLCKGTQSDNADSAQEEVSTKDLRPGDKIIIDSLVEVPCDLVILEGSCAVNEAMLSGESVPLFKEEILGSSDILSFKNHRKHLLFAGTKIEKLYSPLTCVVLRTAYNTDQGVLLTKMLQSEDIKYDPEALKFILLLSAIAILNSFLTYRYSKKSGYALFIDIMILFTNSIPFELPMEMGLSIQSAVKNLMSKKIYCLEPFRITLAGKVEVCCFDKTGTLVDSRLEVKKIKFSNEFTDKVLSSCHNLINVDETIKGDPLEVAIHAYPFEKHPFKIIQQFSFTSELKRQGVLVDFGKNRIAYCLKGAPEEIEKYLDSVPDLYQEYKKYASSGYRVISLAYRDLSPQDLRLSNTVNRELLEKNMKFAGFVLLGSSLREYASEMCSILKDAGLKILMITGDNLLTAMNVAEQLKIGGKGVEGKEIDKILESKNFPDYSIFGRAEPRHKELIIRKYQSMGLPTMMVGDGTNDVGALKAADVGIAMLEPEIQLAPSNQNNRPRSFIDQLQAESKALETIKPGDASMAAPFTVRSNSLRSIVEIIQQGRSSLVTTIQMYKILALNSIISAVFLMFVDILGVKFSDPQMVSIGILSSVGFTAITQSKALSSISKQKPITSIFSLYILVSIVLQSFVQMFSLFFVYRYIPLPVPVEKFQPSVLNTVLYIISSIQSFTTLFCNYIGRPFREDIHENKLLGLSFIALVGVISNIIWKFHPDLNELIKVVDISQHAVFVIGVCLFILIGCYLSEKASFRLFMIRN